MKIIITNLIFLIFLLKFTKGAKILAIFPAPSISHQIVFRTLTQDLAMRGHKLTILTPDPFNGNNPNVTEIDLSASYNNFKELFSYGALKDVLKSKDEIGFIKKASVIFETLLNEQLSYPDVKNLINCRENYEFDIMIMEHTGFLPYLAFAEIYDVPVVGITSFEAPGITYYMFGNEANPVIHPELNFPFDHGELTFEQRWKSLKSTVYAFLYLIFPPSPINSLINIYETHFPMINKSLFELLDKIEIFMVNTHPALGFIRPLVPTTIQLGFMHIEPPKLLLDEDLKKFISLSRNGVILISFGSNIASKDLDVDFIESIRKVIQNSKYDFVWKFETDFFPNKPKNLFLSKWLPQSDLLAHQNVKLLITHAGLQSIEEAIDREVPMITIPFLGDQPGIAKKLEQKGVAYFIDPHELTENELNSAINEMVKSYYKENIKNLKVLVYDQPMSSREKAVWWVEYAIRHKGAKHLAYPGRFVPFYQKYWLDFITIFILSVLILRKMFKTIVRFLYSQKFKKE